MKDNEEQRRKKQIQNLFEGMARSNAEFYDQNNLNKEYCKLKALYRDVLRKDDSSNCYADIFPTLVLLKQKDNALNIINQNLNEVYKYCKKKGDNEFCASVKMFIDYTNLEIARINYVDEIEKRINVTDENFGEMVDGLNRRVDEVKEKTKKASDRIKDSYSDFISILGIFSGIVLVFFGGTSIFGSAISNVKSTNVESIILACAVVGMIVFDIIFMFMYFVSKLLDRSIAATSEVTSWQPIFIRFKKRYPLIYWFNLFSTIISGICGLFIIIEKIFETELLGVRIRNYTVAIIASAWEKNKIALLLAFAIVICNILFVFMYFWAKVTDTNIGVIISLSCEKWIDWEYKDDNQYVIRSEGKEIKSFKNEIEAERYVNKLRYTGQISTYLKNLGKRVFLRYPYMSMINIILLVTLLIVSV